MLNTKTKSMVDVDTASRLYAQRRSNRAFEQKVAMLYQTSMSVTQISEKLGCSNFYFVVSSIVDNLKVEHLALEVSWKTYIARIKAKDSIMDPLDEQDRNDVEEFKMVMLYRSGLDPNVIAEMMNVSYFEVMFACKDAGVLDPIEMANLRTDYRKHKFWLRVKREEEEWNRRLDVRLAEAWRRAIERVMRVRIVRRFFRES